MTKNHRFAMYQNTIYDEGRIINPFECMKLLNKFYDEYWDLKEENEELKKENNKQAEQLNKLYGEQILKLTDERKTEFFVDKNNIYAFIHLLPYINRYYGDRYKITKVGLDNGWSEFLDDILDGYLSLEWDGI